LETVKSLISFALFLLFVPFPHSPPLSPLPPWTPHAARDRPDVHEVPHDIFATLLREPTRASIGARAEQLKADHGHIVVRVAPDGASYRVFVLDDSRDTRMVLGVFGPYRSQ
jgi:hypothetical protein